jgi:hypothetical protein
MENRQMNKGAIVSKKTKIIFFLQSDHMIFVIIYALSKYYPLWVNIPQYRNLIALKMNLL